MNLQQQIGPMLLSAYRDQNVAQLKEWFNRFPEAINILTQAVGEAPLKAALRDNMWLSATFLLNQPNIPKKTIQIESAIDNPHQVCPMLIQAQVQNLDSKKLELLRFLHDRVRL